MPLPEPYYTSPDGRIVLYCADCRDVLPQLEPGSIDAVVTDPPYGIGLESHKGSEWSVTGDDDATLGAAVLAYCLMRWPVVAFASPMRPWPGQWHQYLVWDKGEAVGGGGDPRLYWKRTWELIQVANLGTLNGRRDGAVLRYWVNPDSFPHHPCQKPLALLQYLVKKTTRPNAVVLDPFAGSGTTLVAAQALGRRAIGIEIEERYCRIAVERLHQQPLPLPEPEPVRQPALLEEAP